MREEGGENESQTYFIHFYFIGYFDSMGCGPGVYRMYPGPRLPKSQIALLRWDSAINVIFVDGRLVPGGP